MSDVLPFLTADLPGIAGEIKRVPGDFIVEEIPAYPPSGAGEFLFLQVEKTGLSSEQLVSHLARDLKIAHQDVGIAGMKDRQAVTRQMVSVPARCEVAVKQFRHEQIRILETHRHGHKLRTGHLRGNQFSILVRDPIPDAASKARAIADRLSRTGVPNYFGDQRFGRDNETLQLGFDLLSGKKRPADIPRARRRFLLRLALSAVQSRLFNQALARRMQEGTLQTVLAGDAMQVVASGGPFVVEDRAREQARFDAGEVVISGPIFGPKMKSPAGEVATREAALLAEAGLSAESFSQFANLTPGTRRPYLIRLPDLRLAEEDEGIRFEFSLPSGSYATVVLREFQK